MPSRVMNAMAEMTANSPSFMLLTSKGAVMLLLVTSMEPLGQGAQVPCQMSARTFVGAV